MGRLWSRRELLSFLTLAGGGAALAACAPATFTAGDAPIPAPLETDATATPAPGASATRDALAAQNLPVDCVVSPQMTEGPFFVDAGLNRRDIRTDPATNSAKAGALLTLALTITHVADGACSPPANALVDIWHCDADGIYSGVADRGASNTELFLRGQQYTDANGKVEFVTIYPGWYPGRAVHIHFKVRSAAEAGGTHEFTSQFFFDEATTDLVFAQPPYNARGARTTRNENDGIFRGSGGDQLLLPVVRDGEGWRAAFTIGMAM